MDAVLRVLAGTCGVGASLESSNLRAVMLMPEFLLDETRASGTSGLALACASAWRAVVAADRLDGALAHQTESLVGLIEEVTRARDVLRGLSAFALDANDGPAALAELLDEALERFVALTRAQALTQVRARPGTVVVERVPRILSMEAVEPGDSLRQLLPGLAMICVFCSLLFHLTQGVAAPVSDDWIIDGDLESGHARLVPGGPQASERHLKRHFEALEKRGFQLKRTTSADWLIARRSP